MNQKIIKYIQGLADGLFKEWPITSQTEVAEEEGAVKVSIETDKNQIFTQPNPEPLLAAQHLLRLAVKQKFPQEFVRVVVDIGGFHLQQQEGLKQVTQAAIDKVLKDEEAFHLSPMSSFERRVVHMYAAENDKVVSESMGSDKDRHVVIKPKE